MARGYGRARGPRRRSTWEVGFLTNNNFTGGALVLAEGIQLNIAEVTIARMHGEIQAQLTTTVNGVNEGYIFAVGIGIVPTSAFDVGAASCPDPAVDISWEGWMYHRLFELWSVTATLSDGVNSGSASFRQEIDVKAMRKFGADQTLVLMINSTESGTATASVKVQSRTLMLLP